MNRKFDPKKLYKDFVEKNKDTINKYSSDPEKMKELVQQADEKAEKNEGYLRGAVGKVTLLASLLKAYKRGEYRQVSRTSIFMVIVTLLYFVTPFDAWPDFLPLGYVDDLALLGYTIRTINEELITFKAWKEKNDQDTADAENSQ
ncbi:YkvA family protein [Salimicrobium sp. PL1-032A]|uniref:YkvA family protein n=1 Tax=Salimicrobium sp. PL1-032A TaxID=3095364 RepID=UPI0032610BBE